jgi:hypothetical protein
MMALAFTTIAAAITHLDCIDFISEDPIGFFGWSESNDPNNADPIGLRKFVDAGKKNLKNVMTGAALEGVGRALGRSQVRWQLGSPTA